MKKDDHYLLGSLLKTTGLKGEIILKFNNDYSEEIQKLESIFIDVDNKLVPFFIEELRPKTSTTAIVKLEGLDTDGQSSEFIDSDFYISLELAENFNLATEEIVEVIGYKVMDQNKKPIGIVIEYLEIPKNPLLNVKTDKGEVLIPAKDELIIEVDDDLREIQVNIADGLLELD